MRGFCGSAHRSDKLILCENIHSTNKKWMAELVIDLSKEDKCVPIVDEEILYEVIRLLKEQLYHENDYEFISYDGTQIFYSYTLDEIGTFDYPIHYLSSIALVLHPENPITLLFPKVHKSWTQKRLTTSTS